MPGMWTRDTFERWGFSGWVPFAQLTPNDLPHERGVYVVMQSAGTPRPVFLPETVAGSHKRRSLTAPVQQLEAAWQDEAEVLYIGKAGGARGLRDRLWAYAKQGRGASAGHAGGRNIWQLPGSGDLIVAWRPTPDVDCGDVEEALLSLYVADTGRWPFANRKGGRHPLAQARAVIASLFDS